MLIQMNSIASPRGIGNPPPLARIQIFFSEGGGPKDNLPGFAGDGDPGPRALDLHMHLHPPNHTPVLYLLHLQLIW